MRETTNYDPNPEKSEAPIAEIEKTIPGYTAWLAKGEKLPKPVKKEEIEKEFVCAAKGYEIECQGTKCLAHIVTRKILHLRHDSLNSLFLCKAHEEHFNKHELKKWYRFVKIRYTGQFKYVQEQIVFVLEQLREYQEVLDEI